MVSIVTGSCRSFAIEPFNPGVIPDNDFELSVATGAKQDG